MRGGTGLRETDGCRLCAPNSIRFNECAGCSAEWTCRRAAGKCVKCGVGEHAAGRAWCAACVEDPDAPYAGYPGGR